MSKIRIIVEGEVAANIWLIEGLWHAPATFILLPDKGGTSAAWLDHAAGELQAYLPTGCFGILTSGSTGEAKLIIGHKKRSDRLVCVLHQLQQSESVSETICALPLSYSYAFVNQWLWASTFKRRLRITRGFSDPGGLQAALSNAQDAMLCLVGSQVSLIRRYYPKVEFPGIIRLHFAGGRFPQEQLGFLKKRFPNAQIFNNYGCAEAMPRLTLRRAEDASEASQIGHTLPGVEMKSDADKKLLFRSPYRAVAYIDECGYHPVADDEWIPTGDLGEQLEDGSWRLLGRANEVFKRFGEKIALPQLLTTVKRAWHGDTVAYREVDPAGEPGWVLVLSPEPDGRQLREVLMAFREHHTRPHWPLRIESLGRMPLLPNGKPDIMGLKTADNKQLHWRQRI